jgi:hypothetical protein
MLYLHQGPLTPESNQTADAANPDGIFEQGSSSKSDNISQLAGFSVSHVS